MMTFLGMEVVLIGGCFVIKFWNFLVTDRRSRVDMTSSWQLPQRVNAVGLLAKRVSLLL